MANRDLDPEAPQDFEPFTRYHQENLIMRRDFVAETYLRHFGVLVAKVPSEETNQILPALEDEIRRQGDYMSRNTEVLTRIAVQSRILAKLMAVTRRQLAEAGPVLCNHLLAWFLDNPIALRVVPDMHQLAEDLLLDRTIFRHFFMDVFKMIRQIVGPVAPQAVNGVALQFHSMCMETLTLDRFRKLYLSYTRCDKLLQGISKECSEAMCVSRAPVRIRNLFNYPEMFRLAAGVFKEGIATGIAVETLNGIADAIDLLVEGYALEVTGNPQAEELTPLFNYTMLSLDIDCLFSFGKYLEHFLSDIMRGELELLTARQSTALGHVMGCIAELEPLLSEY